MDQQTLILLLTIFVGLAALAMLIQAAMLVGMFLVARQLRDKVLEFSGPVRSAIETSQRTLNTVHTHIQKIGNTTSSILEMTKDQAAKINSLLDDASTRAKVQMERAEMVLDDTFTRVQTTASFIQSGVMRPVREVHAVFSGVRTALMHLSRPSRSVDNATADEEMFI
jgi:hypothetical protein